MQPDNREAAEYEAAAPELERAANPVTVEQLRAVKFFGPVRFSDGARGMAQQDFEGHGFPRFGRSWRRENHRDKGRFFYTVDGAEVADLETAAAKLALPPDPNSPAELLRKYFEECDREDDGTLYDTEHAR